MPLYSSRRYEAGDDARINDLYHAVTGRVRSAREYAWQWLDAPGGQGEIWLIEAETGDGEKRLVGHHGIMPLFFSLQAQDCLVGKTENTMVLPDYRRKILYPRYERAFFQEYGARFDALFSTTGPAAALRQRKALGYSDDQSWVSYSWIVGPGALGDFVEAAIGRSGRPGYWKGVQWAMKASANASRFAGRWQRGMKALPISALGAQQAMEHAFFEGFWEHARHGYSFTPRRNREDLAWRFWNNPYNSERITLVHQGGREGSAAYAIVRKVSRRIFLLEDIVCSPNNEELFSAFLYSVIEWSGEQGASILNFMTTSDSCSPAGWIGNMELPELMQKFPMSLRVLPEETMLRKASEKLLAADPETLSSWYVTPFVGEGR